VATLRARHPQAAGVESGSSEHCPTPARRADAGRPAEKRAQYSNSDRSFVTSDDFNLLESVQMRKAEIYRSKLLSDLSI